MGKEVDIKHYIESFNYITTADVNRLLNNKVDKVAGKGLSTNDYTTAEKNKLSGIEENANKTIIDSSLSDSSMNPVQNKVIKTALNGKLNTSNIDSSLSDSSMNPVQNKVIKTALDAKINKTDIDSSLSTSSTNPVQNKKIKEALDTKVDKDGSKVLSTNDFTNAYKQSLDNLESNLNAKSDIGHGHDFLNIYDIRANDDLNDSKFLTPGIFICKLNATAVTVTSGTDAQDNPIIPSTQAFALIVLQTARAGANTLAHKQILMSYSNIDQYNFIKTRNIYGNKFGEWRTIADSYNTYNKTEIDSLLDNITNNNTLNEEINELSNNLTNVLKSYQSSLSALESSEAYQNSEGTTILEKLQDAIEDDLTNAEYTSGYYRFDIFDSDINKYYAGYYDSETHTITDLNEIIPIDSALSTTSKNPVQNKVINTALNNKVDKVSGKKLSTNDYTNADKNKLANIEANANNYIHPETHPASMITDLANIATTGSYYDLDDVPIELLKITEISYDDLYDDYELIDNDRNVTTLMEEMGTIQEGIRYHCLGTRIYEDEDGESENEEGTYTIELIPTPYYYLIYLLNNDTFYLFYGGDINSEIIQIQDISGKADSNHTHTNLNKIELTDHTDLNTIKGDGLYYGPGIYVSNSPIGVTENSLPFYLIVLSEDESGCVQYFYDMVTQQTWVRDVGYNNDEVISTPWKLFYNNIDFPIVDNLTTDSSTSLLSAKQGKVLKGLIDNKVDKETGKGLFTGSYTDLTNKPSIPVDVSELTDTQNTQFTPKSHTHNYAQVSHGHSLQDLSDTSFVSNYNTTFTKQTTTVNESLNDLLAQVNVFNIWLENDYNTAFDQGYIHINSLGDVVEWAEDIYDNVVLYEDLPTIPSKTSDLTNDSGFITSHQDISGKVNTSDLVGTFTELQELITNASSGDTIVLEKNYKNTDNTDIFINKSLNIIGNGHIIDGNEQNTSLTISGNSSVSYNIENVIFTNFTNSHAIQGYPQNNLNINGHTLNIQYCTFINNKDGIWYSGAFPNKNISNCVFINHSAYAIYILTSLTTINCTFINSPINSIYVTNKNYLTDHQSITGKEDSSNKVTSLSSSSTDTQYPSAKLVYDNLNNKIDASDVDTLTATVNYTDNTSETIEFYIIPSQNEGD